MSKGGVVGPLRYVLDVLAFVSAVVTILGFTVGPLPALFPEPWGFVVIAIVLLLMLAAGSFSIWRVATRFATGLEKKINARLKEANGQLEGVRVEIRDSIEAGLSKQADIDTVTTALRDLATVVHDLQTSAENIKQSEDCIAEARSRTQIALRDLARIYAALTGCDTRATIKLVKSSRETPPRRVAVTLARSNTVQADPPGRFNPLQENTDFQAIGTGSRVWHSPKVSDEPNYANTSPNRKYESVIVWGIRDFSVQTSVAEVQLIGFLCVDSETPNAFLIDRDIQIGWWFVDAFRALHQSSSAAFALESPEVPN